MIIDDSAVEDLESFTVQLDTSDNNIMFETGISIVRIVDNDG